MKRHLPFRIRLLLSFWLVPVLFLLLPSLYYHRALEKDIIQEAQANVRRQLDCVRWLFLRNDDLSDPESLDHWVKNVGKRLGSRITYVADDGRVIADTQVPFDGIADLDSHADRPEIRQSRTYTVGMSIRFSETLQKEMIYLAREVEPDKPIPSGVLRISMPFSPVKARLESLTRIFWGIVVVTFIVTTILSYMLARRLGHPIQDIVQAAEAISEGDYKQRVYFYPNQEFYPLAESLNRMAEHIENHIQTITDRKRQFEAILNGMKEGVMFLDAKGKIRAVNRSLTSLLPNPPASIGRRPMEVLLNAELQTACEQVLQGQEHAHLEIKLGDEKYYEINIVRVSDLKGGAGAVVVFHDISELKYLAKVRQDFVANVTHELRTPLTSVKGYAETLLADESMDPESARSFLRTILKNTNNMSNIVNELLELAKLEAHPGEMSFFPVEVSGPLARAWETCAPMAGSKGVELDNRIPESDLRVLADEEQLEDVFRNLLENAIRYSPEGAKITVFSQVDNDCVTLAVQDRGAGIAKAHQQRIFERFYRVEKHRANQSGGTGLGLAICRHILRNHRGSIWVESRPGEGATFFFTLPKAAEEAKKTG